MTSVVASIDIASPPEAIWALLCDPHRYPELADPTERMLEVPDGDMGVGYVYKEYGGVPPFKGESEWRVTEFDPMRRQVHVGDDGSMTLDLEIEIASSSDGSRLTQSLELKPRWYLAPVHYILWPLMMRKRAQEAMDKTVANVKRMLESAS
jgi:carbon monoxide dehydrogenase subunit G